MPKRDPLLVEVLSALGDVVLHETYLVDWRAPKRNFLYGTYEEPGIVTINPAPHVVGTLLHELIHRVRPQWTERTVNRRTTQLLRQMSHQEIQALYVQYQRRVDA